LILGEALEGAEVLEELATLHKLQHKVEFFGGLESVFDADNEGIIDVLQDCFFSARVL